ncbi:MAG: hypothetical protein U1E70_01725 [Acetobacteraceae bacterium]|nr:hypothetical protein [Pseudomonadota bacterium]
MRSLYLALPALVAIAAAASAQTAPPAGEFMRGTQPMSHGASNLPGQPQTTTTFAPSLPAPPVASNKPSDFLKAARAALAAGRTGEAQQAMEMAQTRLLDRSVPLGQTNVPDANPAVLQISQALQDLGAGNRAGSLQKLETALATATAQGM